MRLDDLARQIGAEVIGDGAADVSSAATLDAAGPGQVTFLTNPKYAGRLADTRATAVILPPPPPGDAVDGRTLLVTSDTHAAFQKAVVVLHGVRRHPYAGIHPRAYVDPTASVGEGTTIYPFAYVGPRARIGRDCVLFPGVCVYDDCVVGDRVTLHANTSVGQDGFGYATADGVHHKIPQIGRAVIGDDVEIGANCSVDRGTLGDTVIGRGSKFSNNVVIGHNTRVGPDALFVAQVGVAGSVTIGHHATLGGQVGVGGHLTIGDRVTVGGQSGVTGDLPDGVTVWGTPATPLVQARRAAVIGQRLPELLERIRRLEKLVGRTPGDQDCSA